MGASRGERGRRLALFFHRQHLRRCVRGSGKTGRACFASHPIWLIPLTRAILSLRPTGSNRTTTNSISAVLPLPHTLPGSPIPPMLAPGKGTARRICSIAHLFGRPRRCARGSAGARGAIITAATTYPVRDAVLVAYQARSASCPNGAYMSGIAALAVRAEAGNRRPIRLGVLGWISAVHRSSPPRTTGPNRLSGPLPRRAMTGCTVSAAILAKEIHAGAGTRDGMNGLRHAYATILVAAGRFYIAGDRASSRFRIATVRLNAPSVRGCLR